jgi:Na+/H+-dicarboxylate symporter
MNAAAAFDAAPTRRPTRAPRTRADIVRQAVSYVVSLACIALLVYMFKTSTKASWYAVVPLASLASAAMTVVCFCIVFTFRGFGG